MKKLFAGISGAFVLALAIPASAGELVVNGGFETGGFGAAWVHGAYRGNNTNPNLADHAVVLDLPYQGGYSALLGFKYTAQTTNAYGWMYQQVTIPAGVSSAELNFKMRMQGYDSDPYDPFIADIRNTSDNTLANVLNFSFTEWNDKFKDSGWISDDDVLPDGYDMTAYAGQTVRLYFEQSNLFDTLYETWTYVDEVSLVYRMWVDLAVDGDGDDVFGAPGTGAGGLSAQSGVAGGALTYALTIENEGTVADSYQLAATPPGAGWVVEIDPGTGFQPYPFTTPALAPGTSATYTVRVVSPVTAPGGSYDVIVDAVSTAQASRNDSATLRANVVDAVYGTDVVVDGNGFGVIGGGGAGGFALKQAPWDSTLTFVVEVLNTGNAPTAFDIDFTSDAGAVPAVWYNSTQYAGSFTTAVIPDGGSATLTLEVQVLSSNPGGDYNTILTATSSSDPLINDSILAVLRLRAPKIDMIIATSGDGIYDGTFSGLGGASSNAGERGVVVTFPLIVQNESMLPDSFALDWVAPAGGWTAMIEIGGIDRTFPTTTPVFAPFAQAGYVLKITIPAGAAFGTYQSFLHAISGIDVNVSESVTSVISVASPSEIDLTIDGIGLDIYGPVGTGLGGTSVQNAAPGQTVTFDVTIENILGTNSFEVSWNTPLGWTVTLDGNTSPVAGMVAGTYQLVAIIPAASLGGTFDIIVDAHKTDKPFFMDSLTGRVVVAPPAIVDGIIDGDGDEVFGGLGTGAGGASLQITSAPASLNFTVELQNQGPSADQYQVSWNTIPGWSATFGGGASPFATAFVPAGGSNIYTFTVDVPASAIAGSYTYAIDVVSLSDPTSFESIAASVDVAGPPHADLVIDGNGAGVFGPMGSGQGGTSRRFAGPGTAYNAILRLHNVGSFPDSFRVQWSVPTGWPANSVALDDGTTTFLAPFWTPTVASGAFVEYTVSVQVPPGADAEHTTIINAWSSLPPNATESVSLVTETRALVRGVVYDDRDHDLAFGAGDVGLSGVSITETGSGVVVLTDGAGGYAMYVPAGSAVTIVEQNLSGYVSLSPDTVGPATVSAGDTVSVDFADVAPLYVSPGGASGAPAGGYIDFPHTVEAGTAGQVTLVANNSVGAVTMFLLDENGNGVFDGTDRIITPGDLDLDPAAPGGGVVSVFLRVFVPLTAPVGLTFLVDVVATQTVTATPLVLTAQAADAVVVTDASLGRLQLTKSSDRATAAPGELITYSLNFLNTGADSLQNIVLFDPISLYVDLEPDAFGPGLDLEWLPNGGAPVYLTFNALDPDECEYSTPERLLRIILSKNSPFYLVSGASGALTYRVRVR